MSRCQRAAGLARLCGLLRQGAADFGSATVTPPQYGLPMQQSFSVLPTLSAWYAREVCGTPGAAPAARRFNSSTGHQPLPPCMPAAAGSHVAGRTPAFLQACHLVLPCSQWMLCLCRHMPCLSPQSCSEPAHQHGESSCVMQQAVGSSQTPGIALRLLATAAQQQPGVHMATPQDGDDSQQHQQQQQHHRAQHGAAAAGHGPSDAKPVSAPAAPSQSLEAKGEGHRQLHALD